MDFNLFKVAIQKHIDKMLKDRTVIFEVGVDKDKLWATYLDSFPAGTNSVYRERREHDCSACRHFVKAFGGVVTIVDGKVTSIWDAPIDDPTYGPVVKALSAYVKSLPVVGVFVTKETAFGVDKNYELIDGKSKAWDHLYTKIPASVTYRGADTVDSVAGRYRDIRNVFKRSLDEIGIPTVETVLELISQDSLYRGEEWKAMLTPFLKYQKAYAKIADKEKDNFCWENSITAGGAIGKIRNHAIGTLLIDIESGTELDDAVRKFESVIAPTNYMRPKAIYTKKMLEDAKKKLEELGLLQSLGRRHATLDDISIRNILWANRDAAKRIAGSDVFEKMAGGLAVNPKSFAKVEEISVDDFVKNVLPTATSLEALFENTHMPNRVSLIMPKVKDSKPLFKWGNGGSWAYVGNITDSMKERVKSFGGKVDGVLRFSIQWNDNDDNQDDLDAHCIEPDGREIYFRDDRSPTGGNLDVDIRHPASETRDGVAVENITWPSTMRMKEGKYQFFVYDFSKRNSKSGFTAEIEFDGQVYSFACNRPLQQSETVMVAEVTFSKKNGFSIREMLDSTTSTRKAWGLDTNQFHPVSVVMYSPNYWDDQAGIGNRHYFFMLKGAVNDETPNGFFNEYLKEDLMAQKRVFEALGNEMRVDDSNDQLSGLGFSSSKRNSLVVKVNGHTTRTLKINF